MSLLKRFEEKKKLSGSLELKDLAKIKEEIKTGLDELPTTEKTLIDMYTSDELTYAELYNLAEAGVISKEEADQINERYSVKKDLDKLVKKGVVGIQVDLTEAVKDIPSTNKIVDRSTSAKSTSVRQNMGFDRKYIKEFYESIGATKAIKVDPTQCPIFNGYVLFIAEDKEIGFFEGEGGRTYILPLKIILEQIKNPGSEDDIIRRAKSKSEFNKEKRYIRSTNHTKNWVKNTAEKAAQISTKMQRTDPKAKLFIAENTDLVRSSQLAYDKNVTIQNKTY